MQYDIAIQIINYNTKQCLSRCLKTLLKDLEKSNLKYTILILDNNSKDDLSELQNVFNKENVSFYFSGKNLGFGKGHNYLAKKTNAKYLLILNPDIEIIEPDSIKRLFEKINTDNEIKVIGPKLLMKNKKPQVYDHGELKGLLAKIALRSGNSYWKNRNNPVKCAWVSGAVLLVEKQIFNKVNGFDERLFLYKEEEDLCLRIRQEKYEVLYDPSVKILHIGSVVAKKSKYMKKSLDYFLEKHFQNKLGFHFFKFLNRIIN